METLKPEQSTSIQPGTVHKGLEFRHTIGDVSGMGEVWLAYQPVVKREVAVKVIKPSHANNPDFIRRFEREAEFIARLEHPNIVPLYDFWREPSGAFLVMRYLRGGSLKNQFNNGPQPPGLVLTWLEQVGSALALAHAKGIIHRDIKPANILLDEFGVAYLLDFGIARTQATIADPDESGTFGYAAPEQFRGEATDERTDLFSLGVVLYELLTGVRGFSGLDGMVQLLNRPLPPIQVAVPSLPHELDDVIQVATAKDPADRYQTIFELMEAFEAALGDATADDSYTKPLDVPNPYRGLRAFQESDAGNFYGRGALVDRLLARLGQPEAAARFLAVVGPSGSGKSSVVKAGLLPRLRQNALPGSADWFIVEMFPGAKPFEELEAKLLPVAAAAPTGLSALLRAEDGITTALGHILPEDDSQLLLIIDQFEELFTLASEVERNAFMEALLDALSDPRARVRVVITLRADFYDRPLNYRDFGDLLRKRTEVVLPMSDGELRETIIRPAANVGASFESGLVERMVADVVEEPGALPLLQYALTELFDAREGQMLTLAAYDRLGGITGALAKRADDEYDRATAAQRDTIWQLFMRLVTLGEGAEDTRRRVRLSELGGADNVTSVLDAYRNARLLTTDRDPETREPTVEVAHEALIREWGRLRDWLADSREQLYIQRRLMQEATEWLRTNRDPGLLASGTRLTQFEYYADTTKLHLNDDERAYLAASTQERLAREAAEQARKANEARISRRAQRFQRASLVLGGLIILALVAGLYGSQVALNNIDEQRNIANTQAAQALANANLAATNEFQAQRQADVAQGLALSSQSQLLVDQNQPLAIALGLYAVQLNDPPAEAQQALTQVGLNPGPVRQLSVDESVDGIISVTYSPDGRTIASGQGDGTLNLWDAVSGEVIWSIPAQDDEVTSVTYSPDGERAVSASFDGQMFAWDVVTGAQLLAFDVPDNDAVHSAAYAPDGATVLAGTVTGTVAVYNANSGEQVTALTGHDDFINSVAVAPDGTQALSGSDDGTAILWDLATGEPVHRLAGHLDGVLSVAFSPDGQTALTGSYDASIILWDLRTGNLLRTFNGHAGVVFAVAYGPNGRYALSASDDTAVILWDINSGVVLERLVGHTRGVLDVAFHPDGVQAISSSVDSSIVIWDLLGAFVRQRYSGHADWVDSVAYTPDGKQFVSGSADATLILWDAATGEPIRRFLWNGDAIRNVAFTPDGSKILSADEYGVLALWDTATGEIIHVMDAHDESDWVRVANLPGNTQAVSGGTDGRIIYWDLVTGEAQQIIKIPDAGVRSVVLSPDGQHLLTATDGGQVFMWALYAEEPTRVFEADAPLPIAVFNPDMTQVAAGTMDGEIIVWDVASGDVVQRLFGHRELVVALAFHPDGKRLLSAAWDTSTDVIMWDLNSGTVLNRFINHTDLVTDIAISPDGETALSSSDDRTVIAWDLRDDLNTVDQQVAWICGNRAVAALADADLRTFRLEGAAAIC